MCDKLIIVAGITAPYLSIAVATVISALVLTRIFSPRTQDRYFGVWDDELGTEDFKVSQDPQSADRPALSSSRVQAMATRVSLGLCGGIAVAETTFFFLPVACDDFRRLRTPKGRCQAFAASGSPSRHASTERN